MAYAALTSARLGLRSIAIIGVDRITERAAELDLLRAAGVTLELVPIGQGPVFDNLETVGGRVQTCIEPGDPVPVIEVRPAWSRTPSWLVVPVAAETLPEWATAVPGRAHLTLGWQGILRVLAAGRRTGRKPPERTALTQRADLVGVSRQDLGPSSVDDALAVLRPGARLVVTDGQAGGLIATAGEVDRGAPVQYRAIRARQVDPTGAGDVFLAALAALPLIQGRTLARDAAVNADDAHWAAAAAALAVEGVGLAAVPDRAAVEARVSRGA